MIRLQNIFTPTQIGILALIFWSTNSLVVKTLSNLPIFELIALAAIIPCLLGFKKAKKQNLFKTATWHSWLASTMGIAVQQYLYILAFKYCLPHEADMLIFLWPLMTIILSVIVLKTDLTVRKLISGFLGLSAVFALNMSNGDVTLNKLFYFIPLGCALSWSLYTVYLKKYKIDHAQNGIAQGLGGLIALTLHLNFEQFVMPNLFEIALIIYYGSLVYNFGNQAWNIGIKNGDMALLTLLSYFKPIASMALLISFGFVKFNSALIVAASLVVMAAMIANDKFVENISNYFQSSNLKVKTS